MKKKKYYLVDTDHNKSQIRKERLLETASKICLKYGIPWKHLKIIPLAWVKEFWKHEEYCSPACLFLGAQIKEIKWYIRNKISQEDIKEIFKFTDEELKIWNGSFIHGFLKGGKTTWNPGGFPSFGWQNNSNIKAIVKNGPFKGGFKIEAWPMYERCRWSYVPCIYLPYSETSLSFMAGVLSTGTIWSKKDKVPSVSYRGETVPIIKSWGIPIEKENRRMETFISPFWPALFSLYMPKEVGNTFLNVENAPKADLYASILWKVYCDGNFPRRGIPYLRCRRAIYKKFNKQGINNVMERLEMLRLEENLTGLNGRIKNIVHEWKEILYNKEKEK